MSVVDDVDDADALPSRASRKEVTLAAHELAQTSAHAVRVALLQDDAPAAAMAWLVEVVTSAQALMAALQREQADRDELRESPRGDPQDRCEPCDINILPAGSGRCPRCLGDLLLAEVETK